MDDDGKLRSVGILPACQHTLGAGVFGWRRRGRSYVDGATVAYTAIYCTAKSHTTSSTALASNLVHTCTVLVFHRLWLIAERGLATKFTN
jgi:hypothetical protein